MESVIRARNVSVDAGVGGKDDDGVARGFLLESKMHFGQSETNASERLTSTFVAVRRYDTDVRDVFGGYEWVLWQVDDDDARAVLEEVGYESGARVFG